ncbi:MAG TPA: hypothetical protein VFK30_00305 [Anaerolineae bacterium]|nr:hypothetical protein [Anaerolineae bacterium]
MELLILVGAVVAVLGAMMITLALSPNSSKAAPQSSIDQATTEAPAAEAQPPKTGIQMAQAQTPEEIPSAQPVKPAPVSEEPAAPVSLVERHDEVMMPTHPLQLEATEIISAQIERLQAEYIRISEDRTRLAQELLTSWLIDKFEESPNRLKSDTKREAQDLRQQLVKVSAEFERVEFRLSSLQNLQYRLDDPRVTQQIDDLVYAVKQLAREH